MAEISVATWNLHHGVDHSRRAMEGTWGYLRDHIKPTVALVQETDGVPPTPGGRVVTRTDDVGFETAVVAYAGRVEPISQARSRYKPKQPLPIANTVPPTHAAARVELPGITPFAAVSLYGRIIVYSQTQVLHAIADLVPLFDDKELGGRIIVGGDLNVFNNGRGVDAASRDRWAAILELFRSMGLVNLLEARRAVARRAGKPPLPGCRCGMGDDCYHVETWRPAGKRDVPGVWCLDYLFARREMAERMVGVVEVWPERDPEVWNLSDHCPLVARFEL